jgi:protein associated with RNAse G/E
MKPLLLHSRKYDGSLHYRYPVRVVQASAQRLITYAEPVGSVESYRGCSAAVKNLLSVFWVGRDYVLHFRWDAQWRAEGIYVDIAMDTGWTEASVGYVDMDLDVVVPCDEALRLEDEDEFEIHRLKWSYPEDVVRRCWRAVEEVQGLLATGQEPFNRKLFGWRVGGQIVI